MNIDANIDIKTEIETETCSICIENIKLPYKLECGHKFCYLCLKFSLISNTMTCPLCRQEIDRDIIENATCEEIGTQQSTQKKWFYSGRTNGYWEYDNISSHLLEKAYQEWIESNSDIESEFNPRNHIQSELEENGMIPIPIGDINIFYFNFKDMYQYNHRNGAKRNIKRLNDIKEMDSSLIKGIAGMQITNTKNAKKYIKQDTSNKTKEVSSHGKKR
jgi:hypothetical protein